MRAFSPLDTLPTPGVSAAALHEVYGGKMVALGGKQSFAAETKQDLS